MRCFGCQQLRSSQSSSRLWLRSAGNNRPRTVFRTRGAGIRGLIEELTDWSGSCSATMRRNLVWRGREAGPGQQDQQQCQRLATDRRARSLVRTNAEDYPPLIFHRRARCDPARECPT